MALQVIEHNVNTEGPPAAVFALLADGSTWPRWSPIDAFELEAPGAGDPEGVGAIRVFTTGRHVSRERVVTVQPDEVFSYDLLSGMAIRDYRAVVTLSPLGEGTSIHWRSTENSLSTGISIGISLPSALRRKRAAEKKLSCCSTKSRSKPGV